MGSIRIKRAGDDRVLTFDENITGAQVKQALGVSNDSILTNARNQIIADNERIGNKVRDGEEIAVRPRYQYW
ncbi:MAG: hypothetical protein FGF52_03935 [Candidatus Brockarchaeota archaeon]|nr:hypothetical protein [Candidatus Brockarchaeota archaeon]